MLASRSRRGHGKLIAACFTIVLAALVASAPAYADKGGTAKYRYHVTLLDYHGVGDLGGGKLPDGDCRPNIDSAWTGSVNTSNSGGTSTSDLTLGDADLEVGKHGSSGSLDASIPVTSYFTDAFYTVTTACSAPPPSPTTATDQTTTPCGRSIETGLTVLAAISGGVGNRLTVEWSFRGVDGSQLVPDLFICGETFRFPVAGDDGVADCKTKTTIKKLNQKHVVLPFSCQYGPITATPEYYGYGEDYTYYRAFAQADGLVQLQRRKG